MERRLFREIVRAVRRVVEPGPGRCGYPDGRIVLVWLWAALHDRPVSWACRRDSWPLHLRRGRLPCGATMSRRLRTERVRRALARLERAFDPPAGGLGGLVHYLDGKPLPIGGCSKDRQAGFGRAAGCKAKGYKLHALVSAAGAVAGWRVAPMNADERVMARRLLSAAAVRGYVVADANYDSNPLHDTCGARGELQLVTPRRHASAKGRGHHRHSPGRLRSLELTGGPSGFGRALLSGRGDIERRFANLTSFGGGLVCLPPWARTHRRVARWVQAKLIIHACYRRLKNSTCAA